jgi:hypothetical protein
MNSIYRFVDNLNFESCFGLNNEIDVIIPSLNNKNCRDITDRQNVNIAPYKINVNSNNIFLVEYISIKPIMLLESDVINGTGIALLLDKTCKILKVYSNDKLEDKLDEIVDYLSIDYENIITNDFYSIINNVDNVNYFYRTSLHDDKEESQGILVKSNNIMANEILLEMEIMKRYLKGEIKRSNYDEYVLHLKELINNLSYDFEPDYVEDYFERIDKFDINEEEEYIKEDN